MFPQRSDFTANELFSFLSPPLSPLLIPAACLRPLLLLSFSPLLCYCVTDLQYLPFLLSPLMPLSVSYLFCRLLFTSLPPPPGPPPPPPPGPPSPSPPPPPPLSFRLLLSWLFCAAPACLQLFLLLFPLLLLLVLLLHLHLLHLLILLLLHHHLLFAHQRVEQVHIRSSTMLLCVGLRDPSLPSTSNSFMGTYSTTNVLIRERVGRGTDPRCIMPVA